MDAKAKTVVEHRSGVQLLDARGIHSYRQRHTELQTEIHRQHTHTETLRAAMPPKTLHGCHKRPGALLAMKRLLKKKPASLESKRLLMRRPAARNEPHWPIVGLPGYVATARVGPAESLPPFNGIQYEIRKKSVQSRKDRPAFAEPLQLEAETSLLLHFPILFSSLFFSVV